MLLMNGALLLGLFAMSMMIKKFDLLVECESIPMQHDDPRPNYEDTREFYGVGSLKKANNDSSFIKLAFVVDHKLYSRLGENNNTVSRFCQGILRFANSLFQPHKIFIALVDIIWLKKDEIDIVSTNITVTHTTFKIYARNLFKNNHNVDHVILLSFKLTKGLFVYSLEIVDKKYNLSIGVINTADNIESNAARLIFLFADGYKRIKMNEDLRKCFEPLDNENEYLNQFRQYFENSTEYKKKHCIDKFMDTLANWSTNFYRLKTKSDILYKKPVCGNNVTEPGEQCDCKWLKLKEDKKVICDNQCCDAATCRYKNKKYSCAFGECCDLNKCSVKRKEDNIICRPASHPCDVTEYCDGEAAFCPNDKFVRDGGECSVKECHNSFINDGVVFCQGTTDYKGVCNSEGRCQDKKKISSPIYVTNTTDTTTTIPSNSSISSKLYGSNSQLTSTTVHSDSSTSSKFYGSNSQLTSTTVRSNPSISSKLYGSNSQLTLTTVYSDSSTSSECYRSDSFSPDFSKWKTYFYLVIVVGLMIGIKFSSHLKKHYLRFHTQSQSQVNHGMVNESTPTINKDNQRSTVTALNSIQMDSVGHQEHGHDQLNSAPNTYANPNQQGESTSIYNYSGNTVIYAEIVFPPPVRAVQV